MAVAELSDVCRVLQIEEESLTEKQQEDIGKALETALAWARIFLGLPNLGVPDANVSKHWYVALDSEVPALGVVTSVSVVDSPGAQPRLLAASDWTHDGYRVRLRPGGAGWGDPRYADDVAVPSGKTRRVLTRVDVTTEEAESVNPLIRDGVALAAAAVFTRSPRLGKGLQGESLGDYSYTVAQVLAGDPFFEQAKSIMRPLKKRGALVP